MLIGIDASRSINKQRTGTENYSYYLIKAISEADKKNSYRLYFNSKEPLNIIQRDNFKEIDIYSPRFWTQYRLARELFFKSVDALFIPAHTLPLVRPKRIKTIVTIHDLGAKYLSQYHQFPQKYYLNFSTEYVLKNADRIIAVSNATKKDILSTFNIDEKKVSVIAEGFDEESYNFEKLKNIPSKITDSVLSTYTINKDYFLFVGTIQPRKNLVRLIQAYSNYSRNNDIDLVLVGKKGWLCEEIYELPKKLHIECKVKFLDYVKQEDLSILYFRAKAFVFLSLCEGFGIPLLEAMACGVPVLTSNISSMPEVVGDAGVLVDPYSLGDIEKGFETVLADRNSFSEKGLKQVSKFSWKRIANEVISIFEGI